MAAGEGRRLRPLTERWPKPVLPIDGRPVIVTLLRDLAEAGCARVTVVTGHLADRVEALVGTGEAFGVEIAYARQPRPHGSADAVGHGLAAGARPPLLIATADTVFSGGDVTRFAAAFSSARAPGAVAVRREPPPDPSRPGVDLQAGRVVRIGAAESRYAHASLWAMNAALEPYLDSLGGPPYELAEAYQRAIDDGQKVSAFEVGRTRDLTDPLDLVKENFPYLADSE
jgi:dTDP-glucose pyrophosphorylase